MRGDESLFKFLKKTCAYNIKQHVLYFLYAAIMVMRREEKNNALKNITLFFSFWHKREVVVSMTHLYIYNEISAVHIQNYERKNM